MYECVADEKVQKLVSVTTVGISSKTVRNLSLYGCVADDYCTHSGAFPVQVKFASTFSSILKDQDARVQVGGTWVRWCWQECTGNIVFVFFIVLIPSFEKTHCFYIAKVKFNAPRTHTKSCPCAAHSHTRVSFH